jgi:hypothetical protein
MDNQDDSKSAVSADTDSVFAWSSCAQREFGAQVSLKQQTVDDGFAYARQLHDKLQECISRLGDGHAAAFNLMGGNEIRDMDGRPV